MISSDLHALADLLPEATLFVESDGSIQACNKAAVAALGYSVTELAGRSLPALVTAESGAVFEYLKACLRSNQLYIGAFTFVRKDAAHVRYRTEGAVCRLADGIRLAFVRLIPKDAALNRFIGLNQRLDEAGREISRRRRAEEATAEQREFLRVTLTSIGDAMIATDIEGRITIINPVAQALTGYGEPDAIGAALGTVFNIINGRTREPAANPADRAVREGIIVGLANPTLLITRDGNEIPIDDSAAPIRNAAGKVIGAVLIFRDITEHKRSQDALRHADRRKDHFLAVLSHELRGPLSPIRSSLSLLDLQGPLNPAQRTACAMIERQVRHLGRLLDDLLDVSRITQNKLRLRIERLELQSVIRAALDSCRPQIELGRHELVVSLPPHPLYVDGDAVRLEQVISNILLNAVKYTDPGGRIEVRLEQDGASPLKLSITDTGIGISAEHLRVLFELFSQVDSALDRSAGGLGIGLSVAQNLVQLHGGTIEAHSAGPAQGSTFMITLPPAPDSLPAEVQEPPQLPARADGGLRILLADDNSDSLISLAMLLQVLGHEVELCNDGTEAIRAGASFEGDVAILDIGMPGANGYDVARSLRARAWGRRLTLIALSGWGQEHDRQQAQDAGFDHHLTKPVDVEILQRLLASTLAAKAL